MEQGMYCSDRCQFCGSFGDKIEPYLCSGCRARIWELGYRKLAPDQSLPEYKAGRAVDTWIAVEREIYGKVTKDILTPDNGAVFMKVLVK